MANYPSELKYTKDHEWARVDGGKVVVGVTWHAQDSLGDVVYVELPKVGASLTSGATFGAIESSKAVSELFAPISGEVLRVNDKLASDPQTVNSDPYGDGWLVEIALADTKQLDELMDAETYQKSLAG